MSGQFPKLTVLALGLPLLLAACGGHSGGSNGGPSVTGPDPTTPSPESTLLTASVSELALSVNDTALNPALTGQARNITVINNGADDAADIAYSVNPGLPSDTLLSTTCGAVLAPGASCLITVTPGATSSAAPGDIDPQPAILSVSGSNTNTLTVSIQVLTYGSVYQGGYLFAVDDTTLNTGDIGGKVVALNDLAAPSVWGDLVDHGVNETASTPCQANQDGACNTRVIAAADPVSAAAQCVNSVQAGFADWYLPAICEMGYDSAAAGTGCGNLAAPAQQNIQSNLANNAVGGLSGSYWSSTELSANPVTAAFLQEFGAAMQYNFFKANTLNLRCVRQITH